MVVFENLRELFRGFGDKKHPKGPWKKVVNFQKGPQSSHGTSYGFALFPNSSFELIEGSGIPLDLSGKSRLVRSDMIKYTVTRWWFPTFFMFNPYLGK